MYTREKSPTFVVMVGRGDSSLGSWVKWRAAPTPTVTAPLARCGRSMACCEAGCFPPSASDRAPRIERPGSSASDRAPRIERLGSSASERTSGGRLTLALDHGPQGVGRIEHREVRRRGHRQVEASRDRCASPARAPIAEAGRKKPLPLDNASGLSYIAFQVSSLMAKEAKKDSDRCT